MFPETNDITFSSSVDIHGTRSYLFDFDTGDFVVRDGKLIECDGIEAVKVWIDYSVAFIESELKREIEAALLQNPQIRSVTNMKIIRGINSLTVEMEVTVGDTGGNPITVTVAN